MLSLSHLAVVVFSISEVQKPFDDDGSKRGKLTPVEF